MGLPADEQVEETLKKMAESVSFTETDLSPYYALELITDEHITDADNHTLLFTPEPGTVVVHRAGVALVDDNNGTLFGLLGIGTVDYVTRKVTVKFDEPSDDPILVDYEHNKNR